MANMCALHFCRWIKFEYQYQGRPLDFQLPIGSFDHIYKNNRGNTIARVIPKQPVVVKWIRSLRLDGKVVASNPPTPDQLLHLAAPFINIIYSVIQLVKSVEDTRIMDYVSTQFAGIKQQSSTYIQLVSLLGVVEGTIRKTTSELRWQSTIILKDVIESC